MDPMFFLVYKLMQNQNVSTKEIKKGVQKPCEQDTFKRRYNDLEFWLTVGIYV